MSSSKIPLSVGAERLGVSGRTLRRYIAQGRLHAYKVGPRMIRVDSDELEALLKPMPTAGGDPHAA